MKIAGVVLAAGLGTRMNSSLPKVLHSLCGMPMLQYVVDTIRKLQPEKIVVVVGKHAERIQRSVHAPSTLSYVEQMEPKGTGDALLIAARSLRNFRGDIIVVNGDSPFLTTGTIRKFLTRHRMKKRAISLLSFIAADPTSYGRIVRDDQGNVKAIVEEKDASAEQRKIREVNSGVYAITPKALNLLKEIPLNKAKGEYYLTDIVRIAVEKNMAVSAFCSDAEDDFFGINTPRDLDKAGQMMKVRMVQRWRDRGVQFLDASSVFISAGSRIGKGTVIYPNVHIEGTTIIGSGCTIFPNVRILDSAIGDGAIIKDSTLIEKSVIKKNSAIGPFAHLRPGCTIGENAKIGNFVEVKNSVIGAKTKASHLSYLGDASIGSGVNIGAGTIICNYDGFQKHVTSIEDDVFIGSDTQLIAPVTIAKGAVVGAGSTITGDVPAHALALSRVKQTNIENWALRRQQKAGRQYAADRKRQKTKKNMQQNAKE